MLSRRISWGILRRMGLVALSLAYLSVSTSLHDRPSDMNNSFRPYVGDVTLQDFEKPGLGRLVDDWEDVQGKEKGYPHFNKLLLFADSNGSHNAHSGHGYLVMRTAGGHTAFQTYRTLLVADPQKSYLLKGWYRTVDAKKNSINLSLRWLDASATEILAEHKSTMMPPAPDWTEVTLEVDQVSPLARYVQIRLNYGGPDVRGECWFDDVELISQAKIIVDTGRPGHVYDAGDAKNVTVGVPAFQSPYRMDVLLRDLQGRTVMAPKEFPMTPGRTQEIVLPDLHAGYYELDVRAEIPGGSRSRKTTALSVMDESLAYVGEKDFGIVVNPYLPGYEHSVLYTKMLGSSMAKLVLWDAAAARGSSVSDQEILKLVRDFVNREITLTAVLGRPHQGAGESAGVRSDTEEDPLIFYSQGNAWEALLKDRVSQFGAYIRNWQILREGDMDISRNPMADDILTAISKVIRETRSFTSLGVAVPMGAVTDSLKTPRFFAFDVRSSDPPPALPRVQDRAFHYTMAPRRLEAGDRLQARSVQLADFVQRCILAKKAGVHQIFWELQGDPLSSLLDSEGIPLPTFLALRTVNQLLSGARVEEKHLFSGAVRDVLFKRDRETIVALWSEQGTLQQEIYFGEDARIIDCFGHITPMTPNAPMEIGPVPVFLVGINTELLDTQRSLRFDQETLDLRGRPMVRKLNFENHFQSNMKDVTITIGKILDRNQKRKEWKVEPIVIPRAEIIPGRGIGEPIQFTLPFSETEGDVDVLIHLAFRTDRRYDLKIVRPLKVSSLLKIDHRLSPGIVSGTKHVQIDISNHSDDKEKTLNLKALVTLPGQPTLEIGMAGLASGGVRRLLDFTFPHYESLRGQKVRVKVFETSGDLFTNREFVLE